MYIPEEHPSIAIETIPYDMSDDERLRLAEKLSYFMVGIQSYYEHDLGLEYIDKDPRPGTRDELPLRIGYLESAKEQCRSYHVAQRLRNDDVSESVDAIRGLLVTNDLGRLGSGCRAIEICEFDVAASDRGKGLGGTMLRYAFTDIPPDTTVALHVAESNYTARQIYERYGFTQAAELQHHGIFDVRHVPMAVKAGVLQQRLGVT